MYCMHKLVVQKCLAWINFSFDYTKTTKNCVSILQPSNPTFCNDNTNFHLLELVYACHLFLLQKSVTSFYLKHILNELRNIRTRYSLFMNSPTHKTLIIYLNFSSLPSTLQPVKFSMMLLHDEWSPISTMAQPGLLDINLTYTKM